MVLLIGGSSGIGKSRLAKALADLYQVQIIEADDLCKKVMGTSKANDYPAIHYWMGDEDWEPQGVEGNVDRLKQVGVELAHTLDQLINEHLSKQAPVIIDGDFISPQLVVGFTSPLVQSLFLYEPELDQIIQNYLSREGGEAQVFRAQISHSFGQQLNKQCSLMGLTTVKSRPWETLIERAIDSIE